MTCPKDSHEDCGIPQELDSSPVGDKIVVVPTYRAVTISRADAITRHQQRTFASADSMTLSASEIGGNPYRAEVTWLQR